MWYPIQAVANGRFLDCANFRAFADAAFKQGEYGLIQGDRDLEVNTWHVDALVDAYKAAQAPEVL